MTKNKFGLSRIINPKIKKKCRALPIIGQVGLGHAILDITGAPEIKIGDTVELPVRRTAASLDVPRIYL